MKKARDRALTPHILFLLFLFFMVEMKKARDRALTHSNTEQECLPLHHLTEADKILEVHCISLLSYDGKGTKWEMRRMV